MPNTRFQAPPHLVCHFRTVRAAVFFGTYDLDHSTPVEHYDVFFRFRVGQNEPFSLVRGGSSLQEPLAITQTSSRSDEALRLQALASQKLTNPKMLLPRCLDVIRDTLG